MSLLLDNVTVWIEVKHAESNYEILINMYEPKESISRFKQLQSPYVQN